MHILQLCYMILHTYLPDVRAWYCTFPIASCMLSLSYRIKNHNQEIPCYIECTCTAMYPRIVIVDI